MIAVFRRPAWLGGLFADVGRYFEVVMEADLGARLLALCVGASLVVGLMEVASDGERVTSLQVKFLSMWTSSYENFVHQLLYLRH